MKNLALLITITTILLSIHEISGQNNSSYKKELKQRILAEKNLNELKKAKFLSKNLNQSKKNSSKYTLYKIINGKPIYRTLDNLDAAIATGTVALQPGGELNLNLEGEGIEIGVWDGGPIQATHVEFQNSDNTASRVRNLEALTTENVAENDDHANHVSGIIIAKGVDPEAKGMATKASVFTYNFNNDEFEIINTLSNPGNNMFLSNHSYGVPVIQSDGQPLDAWLMGSYSADASSIDEILRAYPNYLMVTSAGNSGQSFYSGGIHGGLDKLTSFATSKNNLVVANADPQTNPFSNEITLQINSSSSQGPTDDLRVKPDIAGDGTQLYSPTTSDGYSTFTGTSMSSPNVTGSIALLQQYYKQLNTVFMKSATVKALVLNSAKDDANFIGPDPFFGWGMLNAKEAAETITNNSNDLSIIKELSLENNNTYSDSFYAFSGDVIKATICWTDVKGNPLTGESNLNNTSPRLVNDLDFRIKKEGDTYLPWKLIKSTSIGVTNTKGDNIADNVEKIEFVAPETGSYIIEVSHKGTIKIPGPFQTPPLVQDFSLVVNKGLNEILSIDNNQLEDTFISLWPNPVVDEIKFKIDKPIDSKLQISLFDSRGRLVKSLNKNKNEYQNQGSLTMKNLNSGLYILKFSQGNKTVIKKIIKK